MHPRWARFLALAAAMGMVAAPGGPVGAAGAAAADAGGDREPAASSTASGEDDDRLRLLVAVDPGGPEPAATADPAGGPSAGDRAARERLAVRQRAVARAVERRGGQVVHRYETLPYLAVTVAADRREALAALPGVVAVLPDLVLTSQLDGSVTTVGATTAALDGTPLTGAGWSVAVLDTGVARSHPFFAAGSGSRVRTEACFASGDDLDDAAVGDCPNGEPTMTGPGAAAPLRSDFHGTHAAGIAAGARASGTPTRGVAPAADLVAVQVFSDLGEQLGANSSDLLAGLDWVLGNHERHAVAAVNLSLGFGAYPGTCDGVAEFAPLRDAVARLRTAGVVTVAAAGNGGGTGTMAAPACLSDVVGVAASDRDDRVATFSDVSSTTDVLAPGVGILSSVPPDGWGRGSGTSMAAPHVAGAVALLRQAVPTAGPDALVAALRSSSVHVADHRPGGSRTCLPRLDLQAALTSLVEGTYPHHGFADVPACSYYDLAVRWLKAEGITEGSSTGGYEPTRTVTRAQMAAFLWRAAGRPLGPS
jgi:subtilisin family serine protease